jgi:hypothetical protein
MSVATHRAAIVALWAAVPEIGTVHDEEQYARQEQRFRELFVWQPDPDLPGQVRGWFVRRMRTRESQLGIGRWHNVHSWELRGFMSLDTEAGTGKTFDDLIEAGRRAYRADESLGGAAEIGPLGSSSGMQLTDSRPVVFSGVLCHGATLSFDTHEYLAQGE